MTLIRHGESIANADGQIAGSPFAPLSEKGTTQAEALAKFLARNSYDLFCVSDRPRALQTAKPISRELKLQPREYPILRERDWGELAEARPAEYERQLSESGKKFYEFVPIGGESFAELEARAENFLRELTNECPDKSVLVVAHESINKAIVKVLLQRDWDDWSKLSQRNACISVFEVDSECRGTVTTLDFVEHLKPL